jgi:hypothetical protein
MLVVLTITILCTPTICQKSQVFSTDIGKIQIDIPYTLVPNQYSSGNLLLLTIPNAEFSFSIVTMRFDKPENLTFEDFASVWAPEDNLKFETMTTNDGHKMLFYMMPTEVNRDGNTIYQYGGFIDHINDKNVVVYIFSESEKYFKKVVSTFSKQDFENICKSFVFVN